MSESDYAQSGGQGMSARGTHPPDIPVWTAILAGSVVLSAVGAALIYAENERMHTVRGYLQNLWTEMD